MKEISKLAVIRFEMTESSLPLFSQLCESSRWRRCSISPVELDLINEHASESQSLFGAPSVTTVWLREPSVCCLLADASHEAAAEAIENMADAVTHARFVGTDPASDEVVLMKILQVCPVCLVSAVTANHSMHVSTVVPAASGPEDFVADTSGSPPDQRVCLWDHAVLLQDLLWDASEW